MIWKKESTKEHGALDTKMGISSNAQECSTCHGNLASCHGHFGHIRLALPVFHVGYFKSIISVLQCICKSCAAVLLDEQSKRQYLNDLRKPHIDNLRRMKIIKKIIEQCKSKEDVSNVITSTVLSKKAASGAGPAALKIVHDTFRWIGKRKLLKRQFGTRSWIKFSLEI